MGFFDGFGEYGFGFGLELRRYRGRGGVGVNELPESSGIGRALRGVLIEAGHYGVVDVIGDGVVDAELFEALVQGGGGSFLDKVGDVAIVEGGLGAEQVVERGTEGVEVVAGCGGLALHLLRAHIGNGAAGVAFHAVARGGIGGVGGDAEVGEFEMPLAGDHHISGLDVAMDDVLLVGVIEGIAHLQGERREIFPTI